MSIPSQARAWTMAAALTGVSVHLFMPVQAAPVSAEPADACARTPVLKYQSPLAGIRRLSDAPLGEWRPGQTAAPSPSEKGLHHHPHDHHGHAHAPAPGQKASDPHTGHAGK